MDPIKKAAAVINEYMSDFFGMIGQLPTKDMEVVRKIVGEWPMVKQLLKPFTAQVLKDEDMDSSYVKVVLEDFKKATALLDKLESHYKNIMQFDLEGIKTHTEPLISMMDKMKNKEETPAPGTESPEVAPEAETPEASPEEEPMTKEAQRIATSLDEIASEIEEEYPQVALALDHLADVIEKKRVL
jgi:hypothetical protein